MKHYKKNEKSVQTALTWDEKNPRDYLYHRSEAIIRLRKEAEKEKEHE